MQEMIVTGMYVVLNTLKGLGQWFVIY